MESITLNLEELRLGSVIAEDIMANTHFPIAYKKTPVSREMLMVFRAFNIMKIPVIKESLESNLEKTATKPIDNKTLETISFERKLKEAVLKFKVEFQKWEAGSKVEIVKARDIIIPLIEDMLNDRTKIFTLNDLADSKDYTYHHPVSVALVAAVIANKMNYNHGDVLQITTAALLADCGMAKISKRIRMKPSKLTEFEYKEILSHPTHSLKMVKDIQLLKSEMKLGIVQHHEKLDGSGYPSGVKGDAISQIAHIIAVADVFHAMTSERLYKEKESVFKAVEIIREAGFGKYRIDVIQALLSSVADLPLGTIVELSNSLIGTIVYTNTNIITRPIVKIEHNGELIDLSKKKNVYIHRVHV